ncbi:MAG: DDE-type integrase/transposase/recombinase [archaeon]|jgi:putative transposase
MAVLNQRKIRWIIRQMDSGELSVWQIAKQQKITPRHARRVYTKYKGIQQPKLLNPGRQPIPISKQQIALVKRLFREQPFGACNMEKILSIDGKHIPHNRIHKIMKQEGLAITQPNKSRRRKWIRYERRFSNSLWHIDWSIFEGKWLIAILDDASRFIVGYGLFDNATQNNSTLVMQQAITKYGAPKQLVSDHGVQFTSIARETCTEPNDNKFQKFLKANNIQHIKARVKHPQTNGKLERWWQTNKYLSNHFGSLQKGIKYYNERRPYMSLNTDVALVTPMQAFNEKMRC